MIPENLVIVIQKVYCKYFAYSKLYRAIRCTVLLPDVTEKNEPEQVIKEYHEKSNHRGIDETLAHLKRRVFFLHMKQAITQTINNCDSCQIQKYDRKPNKIKYSLTETPERPMEIVHIDLYFVNKKSVLTIIDKFSRYAWGLTIPAKESVNIVKAVKSFMALFGVPRKIVCD